MRNRIKLICLIVGLLRSLVRLAREVFECLPL